MQVFVYSSAIYLIVSALLKSLWYIILHSSLHNLIDNFDLEQEKQKLLTKEVFQKNNKKRSGIINYRFFIKKIYPYLNGTDGQVHGGKTDNQS